MFGLGVVVAVLGWVARSLFKVSAQWIRTGDKIEVLGQSIEHLVRAKEVEHARFDSHLQRVEARLERHEIWHDDHPSTRGGV